MCFDVPDDYALLAARPALRLPLTADDDVRAARE